MVKLQKFSFGFALFLVIVIGPLLQGDPLDLPPSSSKSAPPRPTDDLQALEYVFHVLKTRHFTGASVPAWTKELPKIEVNIIEEATITPDLADRELAQNLLTRALGLNNADHKSSAERLVLLAAREGVLDENETSRIRSRSEIPQHRRVAERLLALNSSDGKDFNTLRQSLDLPLPNLELYRGSPVVIYFWAASDFRFQRVWAEMRQHLSGLESKGFKIVGLNLDQNPGIAIEFERQARVTWKSTFTGKNPAGAQKEYGLKSLPEFWLIDANGTLTKKALVTDLVQKASSLVSF